MKDTIAVTPRALRWIGALAVPVLAASCYFAYEDGRSGRNQDAPHEVAPPPSSAGDELTRVEWNARVTAMKSIDEQHPEAQRRYHETWIAAMQRVQQQQRSTLEQLETLRAEGSLQSDERVALETRIAEVRRALAGSTERLERHSGAVAALR